MSRRHQWLKKFAKNVGTDGKLAFTEKMRQPHKKVNAPIISAAANKGPFLINAFLRSPQVAAEQALHIDTHSVLLYHG